MDFKPPSGPPDQGTKSFRLIWQIGVATFCRLLLNTARRFPYPFAPALSRGLGVPLASITSVIALNQVAGLLGLLGGHWADRFGYRPLMLVGMGLLIGGMLLAGGLPIYGYVSVGLFLAGLGKSIFDPALQSYVGQRVPFHRRGMAVGLLEVSWAGSSLLGIPLMGVCIEMWSWRAPFIVLGLAGLMAALLLLWWFPSARAAQTGSLSTGNLWKAWRPMVRQRQILGALGFGFCISVAGDNLFVVYGAWLEQSFGLGVVALGAGTSIIGMAELLGESMTALIADRLGLKRAIALGAMLLTGAFVLLPLMGRTLWMALAGLFAVFSAMEFSIVTAFSLSTELAPRARATFISGFLAAASCGRVLGAVAGGFLWDWRGLWSVALTSALFSALALYCVVWGVKRWQPPQDTHPKANL